MAQQHGRHCQVWGARDVRPALRCLLWWLVRRLGCWLLHHCHHWCLVLGAAPWQQLWQLLLLLLLLLRASRVCPGHQELYRPAAQPQEPPQQPQQAALAVQQLQPEHPGSTTAAGAGPQPQLAVEEEGVHC